LEADPDHFLPAVADEEKRRIAIALLRTLLPDPANKAKTTYGDIVASVDHYVISASDDQDKGFAQFLAMKEIQLHGRIRQLQDISWHTGLRHALAVHGNDLHFQGKAIEGIKRFHSKAAILAASSKGAPGLEEAFIANAVADHLVEDFLAAGHAATPRSKFHDVPSAFLHDKYNAIGVPFRMDTEAVSWSRLRALTHAISSAGVESQFIKPSGIAVFVDRLEAGDYSVRFFGDRRLMCNPDQYLYMLLLVTISDLDILESFFIGQPFDDLRSEHWCWLPLATKDLITNVSDIVTKMHQFPKGCTSSGEYDLHAVYTPEASDFFKIGGLMLSYSMDSTSSGRTMRFDYLRSSSLPLGAAKLLKSSVTTDNNACNECSDVTDKNASTLGWAMTSLGTSYRVSPSLHAADLHVNVISAFQWEIQSHFRFGYGLYRANGGSQGKFNGGFGIEKGFGLLFGQLNLDRDYTLNPSGHLHARWIPSLGVDFMFPLTWLRYFSSRKCVN
jgi:hypothetical protein